MTPGSADARDLSAAVTALARGELIVLVDDRSPEIGGYLCCGARHVDAHKINFMVTHGRGLTSACDDRTAHAAPRHTDDGGGHAVLATPGLRCFDRVFATV